MILAPRERSELIDRLVALLRNESEIQRIVVFGSFLTSDTPHDMDVAVYQNTNEGYLPLAVKYRKLARPVAGRIPVDIFPVKATARDSFLLTEIEKGRTVYERADRVSADMCGRCSVVEVPKPPAHAPSHRRRDPA